LNELTIRSARPSDLDDILDLIMQLAIQEGLPEEVKITKEQLSQALFNDDPKVFVSVVDHPEKSGRLAAFALYWIDFPTWLGKHGLYIEDICVTHDLRGKGIGTALMQYLAQLCIDRDYSRLAWWVKNDNASAITFYEKTGAEIKDDFTVRHLAGAELLAFSTENFIRQ
jgi:GNAT superfamily N-acetyltransferase